MTEHTEEKENFSIQKIGKNIEERIFSKYKKAVIAKRMGIKPQTLHTIIKTINSGKNVGIETIRKIAVAGEIPCEELFAQEELQEEITDKN